MYSAEVLFLHWTRATFTQDMNLHCTSIGLKCHLQCKLQAQVYDILPQTTAITEYAIGLEKRQLAVFHWCSNGNTFVTLLQTSQIILSVYFTYTCPCCLHHHKLKPKLFESRWNSSFFPPWTWRMCLMCMHWHHVGSHSLISTQTFPRALTVSVDSCAEVKSGPSLAQPNLAEFGGRCQKVTLGVRPRYWHRCDLPSAPRDLFSQSTVCVAQAPGAITCIHFQAIVWTDESTAHW